VITWIGLCAGEIWKYLEACKGESSLEDIVSNIDAPRETALMAIGWLAREGHVLLRGSAPNFIVKLNSLPARKDKR